MSEAISFDGKYNRSGVAVPFSIDLTVNERQNKSIEVATGTTDKEFDLTDITTGRLLYIKSDKAITVKLATGGTSIPIDANGFMILTGSVTTVLVSNASGATATVEVEYAGE